MPLIRCVRFAHGNAMSNKRASGPNRGAPRLERVVRTVQRQNIAASSAPAGEHLPAARPASCARQRQVVACALHRTRMMVSMPFTTQRSSRLHRAARTLGVGFLTLAAVAALTLAHAAEWQTAASIRDAARELVRTQLGDAQASIDAAGIDERLRLPACTVPLEARAQSGLRNGTGTVAVACEGVQPWRLYVPVRTTLQTAAVIARRAIQAGEPIGAADVALEPRSTAVLPYEYLTDARQAVGATARRTIAAGAVLVPGALHASVAVERGTLVTLIAKTGTVVVRTEGVALETARLNERVRVRSRSGRIVEGTAAAANEVHVGS
jgi:flagella basal body P-ring formation protein FlgA